MGGIHGVAAIHPPWGDYPHRRWVVLQVADLHWRGVGAQQLAIAQIKGVLHVPRGVMLGDVEGREVVVVALDLRPLRHPISQAGKDVDDLLDRADQWVAVARRREAAGRSDVNGFAGETLGHGCAFHCRKPLAKERLHLLFEHVGPLADQGPLIARQLAHGAEHARKAPLLAEQSHSKFFQFSSGAGGGDLCCSLAFQRLELVGELLQGNGGAHGRGGGIADCKEPPQLRCG